MSTAQSIKLSSSPFGGSNACMDGSDISAFLNLEQMASPAIDKGKGRLLNTQTPSLTSPSNSMPFFELPEETHTPMQPSHDYSQYKQQIGLPPQAPQNVFTVYNTGLLEPSSSGSQMFESGMLGGGSDLDSFLNFSQDDNLVDPSFLLRAEEQAVEPVRYYPGMHQEMAKQMMLKQKREAAEAQARADSQRRSASQQPMDAMRDETISRVMSEMRRNSSISDPMSPDSMPHISRMKKDEDDMDEDERLLNSEEGKKLSSKERRQLRNKVSARAFRSRRKEYITQMEAQIAVKANECNALKRDNAALMAENARFHALAEKLISHPAFLPYVEELSRDPLLNESIQQIASGSPPASQRQPSVPKDVSFNSQQFVPSNNDAIVGMTLIPEMPIDLSQLNIGGGQWNLDAFRPQVYAVTETEVAEPFDVSAISGKDSEPESHVVSRYLEEQAEEKVSFPEVVASVTVKETVEEEEFDENNPQETLFASAPAKSASPSTESSESSAPSLFGSVPTEKAFARFEIAVVDGADAEAFEADMVARFAGLEASLTRLQRLTNGYRG